MWKNRIIGTGTADPVDLIPNPKNWRKHPREQESALEGVIEEIGWIQDIIINQRTGRMIDGHLRAELAIKNKEKSVPVKYVDLSEEEEAKALLTLDPITAMAEADKEKLAELLQTVTSDNEDVKKLLDGIGKEYKIQTKKAEEDDYEPPEEIETDIVRGDIFQLGRHRVMCGDSTCLEDVERVMDGKKADMVFTDPPYDMPNELLEKAFMITENFSDLQFWMGADKQQIYLCNKFNEKFTHFFVHDFKMGTLISNNQPMQRHNLISKFGNKKCNNLKDAFCTVIQVATTRNNSKEHKLFRMGKRVELPATFIEHYTQQNDIVLDVFGGAGSTLIACEQLGRQARIIEIIPEYCQIIKDRYEKYIGSKCK